MNEILNDVGLIRQKWIKIDNNRQEIIKNGNKFNNNDW